MDGEIFGDKRKPTFAVGWSNRRKRGDNLKATIAQWRGLKGMSQTELAEAISKTQKTISAWETGKTEPRPSDLDAIHRALRLRATDHILLQKDLT